jgi:hypothetical protein
MRNVPSLLRQATNAEPMEGPAEIVKTLVRARPASSVTRSSRSVDLMRPASLSLFLWTKPSSRSIRCALRVAMCAASSALCCRTKDITAITIATSASASEIHGLRSQCAREWSNSS